ncbi:dihydroneopterin aldolase [Verrucomicrobia bacterium LW23]|nr:dihydroneopterin aldolase [Verrucomicrobia bacterium LW23]
MSDHIRINGMEVYAYIGVPDEERANIQKLLLHLKLYIDSFPLAARGDDLVHTVNYADVTLKLRELALARPRKLIETLAEDTARFLLAEYPVRAAEVVVEKFILPGVQSVAVAIFREKELMSQEGNINA